MGGLRMKCKYTDILSRIDQEPIWFDEHGVPRYEPFTPRLVADIYAARVALVHIQCQNCKHPFKVAFSARATNYRLPDRIRTKELCYGDPPNITCCPPGATMSSDSIRVLEYWDSEIGNGWIRVPELEISLEE